MGLIIASALVLVPGMISFSGSLPVPAKNAFCSARLAVSTLTWALSFVVAETYRLRAVFGLILATRAVAELRNRPAAEVDCFRQWRDACRNEFEAIPDILVLVGKNLIDQKKPKKRQKIICTPFASRAKMLFEAMSAVIGQCAIIIPLCIAPSKADL
jgi:hypothetical protein